MLLMFIFVLGSRVPNTYCESETTKGQPCLSFEVGQCTGTIAIQWSMK